MLAVSLTGLQAQYSGGGNYNYLDFNQKPYYFGITLAINNSSYKPFRSAGFLESDSITRVESATRPGVNLGIITNLKIGEQASRLWSEEEESSQDPSGYSLLVM